MLSHKIKRACGSHPAILTYIGSSFLSTSAATSRTFSSVNIGTDTADRLIIIVVQVFQEFAFLDAAVSSVTIGGSAATIDTATVATEGSGAAIAIVSKSGVSGTTADVVITMSIGCRIWGIHTYIATGLKSYTPVDTHNSGLDSTVFLFSRVDTEFGGVIVAGGSSYNTLGISDSKTDLTEDDNTVYSSRSFHAASLQKTLTAYYDYQPTINVAGYMVESVCSYR